MPGGQVLWPPATLIDNADGTKTDPKFNSTWIVLPQNLRHIYSQLQAFSFDEKYLLLQDVSKDGAVDVYLNAPGFPIVHDLKSAYAPVWSPTSNVIYYLRGSPGRVFKFDVATGQETLLVSYPDIPSFSEARSWEDMDRNGRFKAIVSTSVAKVLVFDVINKTTIFNKTFVELGTSSINWVAVSPSGKYLCIQHDADDANNNAVGRGVDIWNLLTGKFHRNLHGHHNHGDWGIDDLGDYYFSVQESPGHPLNSNKPCLKKYYVEEDRAVTGRLVEWYTHLHFSAKGPKGFPVCISAQPNKDSGKPDHPLMGEIYLHFDNGDVRRLCHHRSGNSPYEAQPHASISPTGKSVIFATNFFGLIRSVIVKTGIV